MTSTCEDLGCDEGQLVPRQRLAVNQSLIVYWGSFASADTVLKSAQDRDWIDREYGAIGFEMEATGACDMFPCIIVKGAYDYADSHKKQEIAELYGDRSCLCDKGSLAMVSKD